MELLFVDCVNLYCRGGCSTQQTTKAKGGNNKRKTPVISIVLLYAFDISNIIACAFSLLHVCFVLVSSMLMLVASHQVRGKL